MAVSFFQKLKLGIRGWSRRRTEEAAKRDADFLARSTSWAKPAEKPSSPAGPVAGAPPLRQMDFEGLQVAFLDDSGRIEYYLDVETGEVVDFPSGDAEMTGTVRSGPDRYRRVPQRSPQTDAADRAAFVQTVENVTVRTSLERALLSQDAAGEFRKALAQDRAVERGWYSFKNRRAEEAIERWLKSELG